MVSRLLHDGQFPFAISVRVRQTLGNALTYLREVRLGVCQDSHRLVCCIIVQASDIQIFLGIERPHLRVSVLGGQRHVLHHACHPCFPTVEQDVLAHYVRRTEQMTRHRGTQHYRLPAASPVGLCQTATAEEVETEYLPVSRVHMADIRLDAVAAIGQGDQCVSCRTESRAGFHPGHSLHKLFHESGRTTAVTAVTIIVFRLDTHRRDVKAARTVDLRHQVGVLGLPHDDNDHNHRDGKGRTQHRDTGQQRLITHQLPNLSE